MDYTVQRRSGSFRVFVLVLPFELLQQLLMHTLNQLHNNNLSREESVASIWGQK